MIYILTGISGCGKSTIGNLLAEKLAIPFYDADNYHPQANLDKMSRGEPLNDLDRAPWLEAINQDVRKWYSEGTDAVIGCSALKHAYREALTSGVDRVQWIQLSGSKGLIEARISNRSDHFFDDSLLDDQIETVEFPSAGWHLDITDTPEEITDRILHRIQKQNALANFGIIGLGVMGQNLVLNCADNGIRIAAFNRHVDGVEEDVAQRFVDQHPDYDNILPFDKIGEFVFSLERPRKVLLMVKAGDPVDSVIEELTCFMQAGDMIIDGGNSHYLDTARRGRLLKQVGIDFVGMGISGGELGARFGPSMMPGTATPDRTLVAVLDKLAATDKSGSPCWTPVGPGGAGHFVKMIHNGIEYAEMQLIAESHLILSRSGLTNGRIAEIFESWQDQELDSFLLEITIDILKKEIDGHLALDSISDVASHKGTGKWSVEAGLDHAVPSNSIFAALFARQASASKSLRDLANSLYTKSENVVTVESSKLKEAYAASRLINHIIGFEIIREASKDHEWQVDPGEIARIWTNGCIIRSDLMERLHRTLVQSSSESLLLQKDTAAALNENLGSLRSIVSESINNALPIPCLTACLTYIDSLTYANSSAHIIAAQRDYFGAHGFTPTEENGPTHFNWTT